MGLISLRLYLTQSLLSYLFGLDESNVSRELNLRLLPVLLLVLPTPLTDAPLRTEEKKRTASEESTSPEHPRPRQRIGTLEELFQAYPDLKEVLVDATEQEVPQPKDQTARKQRYSGKQQRHTVKTQVASLYRKLGVSSRREAVERITQIGFSV